MRRFIVTRLTETIATLLLGSLLCFALIRLLPGDPAVAMYGEQFLRLSEADQQRITENLGLHEPFPLQYAKWLGNTVQGDLGHSYSNGEPVKVIIGRAAGPTILLMLSATGMIVVISLVLGIITGLRRHSAIDHAVTIGSFFLMSIPTFWLALMLILVCSVYLGILPSSGIGHDGLLDGLKHLLMPSLVLALSHIGYYIRILRNHLALTVNKDFIWAMKVRGLPPKTIVFRHLLPNVSVPFVSYVGMSFTLTLGGSVVIESIFSWPGLGRLVLDSAIGHDYPVIMATILLTMSTVVIGSFLIDLVCAWMDPRIRRSIFTNEVIAK
ncbi:ABC transporter permease [Sporosarcina sp. NCCP-2222]|uniref:ABC transporter permease n=1 Tax=Sporosarcina sp. NCCP-2222 TaxID=2935073 RepID=UPI00207DF771|nr:ABC transporter permease [Sporosarcina sp. NCCP-2222]GKV56873.1 ABC transporter permease [Sporosarcina sp. NCCP-2222]